MGGTYRNSPITIPFSRIKLVPPRPTQKGIIRKLGEKIQFTRKERGQRKKKLEISWLFFVDFGSRGGESRSEG